MEKKPPFLIIVLVAAVLPIYAVPANAQSDFNVFGFFSWFNAFFSQPADAQPEPAVMSLVESGDSTLQDSGTGDFSPVTTPDQQNQDGSGCAYNDQGEIVCYNVGDSCSLDIQGDTLAAEDQSPQSGQLPPEENLIRSSENNELVLEQNFGYDGNAYARGGPRLEETEAFGVSGDAESLQDTISQRLVTVIGGYKGFISRTDPLLKGPNCAGYATKVINYIFGPGKYIITGVENHAWNMPKFIESQGGTVRWFDWRNGDVFADYGSLVPGDILGIYYSNSEFRSDLPKGRLYGNTPDVDFTHVVVYLGEKDGKHIVTHLLYDGTNEPVRIEPLEGVLSRGYGKLQIRALMRPKQNSLYLTISKNYMPEYEMRPASSVANYGSKEKFVIMNINKIYGKYPDTSRKRIKVPVNFPSGDQYAQETVPGLVHAAFKVDIPSGIFGSYLSTCTIKIVNKETGGLTQAELENSREPEQKIECGSSRVITIGRGGDCRIRGQKTCGILVTEGWLVKSKTPVIIDVDY